MQHFGRFSIQSYTYVMSPTYGKKLLHYFVAFAWLPLEFCYVCYCLILLPRVLFQCVSGVVLLTISICRRRRRRITSAGQYLYTRITDRELTIL